jgi:hypothetical protein
VTNSVDPSWLSAVVADDRVLDAALLPSAPGEPVTLVVVPQGFQQPPALRALARAAAPAAERPARLVLLTELPRTDGRLDAPAADRLARLSRYAYPYEPAGTPAEQALLAEVQTLFPGVEISMTDSLADLGGDSLTAIQLAERLESGHGRPVDPSELFGAESLRALARQLGV